jgi:ribosome modulation factor
MTEHTPGPWATVTKEAIELEQARTQGASASRKGTGRISNPMGPTELRSAWYAGWDSVQNPDATLMGAAIEILFQLGEAERQLPGVGIRDTFPGWQKLQAAVEAKATEIALAKEIQ